MVWMKWAYFIRGIMKGVNGVWVRVHDPESMPHGYTRFTLEGFMEHWMRIDAFAWAWNAGDSTYLAAGYILLIV